MGLFLVVMMDAALAAARREHLADIRTVRAAEHELVLRERARADEAEAALAEARRARGAALDAAELLWCVVANASGGDWTKETPEWQGAAARARDAYHVALDAAALRPEAGEGEGQRG